MLFYVELTIYVEPSLGLGGDWLIIGKHEQGCTYNISIGVHVARSDIV